MPVGDPSPPTDDPLIGKVLSERYRIVRKIGEGGMGAVYQAEHALIEKKIALKILFQDLTRRPDLVARFLQEAKSASRIGHENVIDISDFGQSPDGLVFIAMEYLDGQDLGKRAQDRAGAMDWQRARPILMQITKALRAAHGNGIIHRDMKPENVYLVQREGRPDFVKVLDFGIAKIINPDEADGPRADADRDDLRDARVHVARAGAGQHARPPRRRLRGRLHHVPHAHRARSRSRPTTSWAS